MGKISSVHDIFNTPERLNVLRKTLTDVLSASGSLLNHQSFATRWVDRHESISVYSNLPEAVVAVPGEILS